MRFAQAAAPAQWFWSQGTAWGTIRQSAGAATLAVLGGPVRVERVLIGKREYRPPRPGILAGDTVHDLISAGEA
jgi:hypothetical protein